MASVKLFVIFFFVLGVAIIHSSSGENNTGYLASMIAKRIGYRLPNNIIPKLYQIRLDPHIDDWQFTFDGTSTVNFEVISPTSDVILHVSEFLEIDKSYTKLTLENGTIWKPNKQGWNSVLEFFFIRFDSVLTVGNYSMDFKWLGHDARAMNGFFRSEIRRGSSSTYMVTTHFQTRSARGAFPCWDEPGYRAKFDISLKHSPNYTAISNMPVKNHTDAENGKIWTTFERTPSMSTYLVTFVLVDYEKYINQNGNITFWAPEDDLKKVEYAFNISRLVVPALEEYTGVEYVLPKLDQVVMPRYPSSGTEHWGMISYGSYMVEYTPENHSVEKKDLAALLIAHEISHQWFGNLVTPTWWDDLWLSEAFAVYFSYKILNQVLENQHFLDTFVVETVNTISFNAEIRSRTPRPIVFKTDSPSEVRDLFSLVTYRKGAAVVQMLEHIVSSEVFQSGIQKYLKKHRMSTVKTDDLWQSLQEAYDEKKQYPDMNIKEIMDPWIRQTGYPMLNVTRDYTTGLTNITQMDAMNSQSNNSWSIPVNFATSSHINFNSTTPTHWMLQSNKILSLSEIDKNDWLILNVQQTGFYRVNYDHENWKRIAEYLNSENYHNINVRNRAQLIWDLYYIFPRENHYLGLLLDILSYLHREIDYLPWIPAIEVIESFSTLLINTPANDIFSKYSLYLMNNIVDHIGFENTGNDDRLVASAQSRILPSACELGHTYCRNLASTKVIEKLQSRATNSSSPDLDMWVYCTGLKTLNSSVWENLMDSYFEDRRLEPGIAYLGCSNNHTLQKKYLDMTITNNSNFNGDEFFGGFSSVLSSKENNVDFALEYFIENFEAIRRFYYSIESLERIERIVQKICETIRTNAQLEKIREFLMRQWENGMFGQAERMIDVARNQIMTSERISTMFLTVMNNKPYLANFINA